MRDLNVLIIDDERDGAARLAAALTTAGHRVRVAHGLEDAQALREADPPDVTVLDRMIDGRDTLSQIEPADGRLFREPVLVLTALADLDHRLFGLNAGADDYLAKPAAAAEVEARLRALVRRPNGPSTDFETIEFGLLRVDRLRREAWCEERRLALQPREFRLLEELAMAGGEVVTRRMLLERVWNLKFDPRTKLIESHVSRLRDKLAVADCMPTISAVRGVGYRLVLH